MSQVFLENETIILGGSLHQQHTQHHGIRNFPSGVVAVDDESKPVGSTYYKPGVAVTGFHKRTSFITSVLRGGRIVPVLQV